LEITSRDGAPRKQPVTIGLDEYAGKAVNLMEKHIITTLVVTNKTGEPIGLIRWIELSLAGVV
jgi:predicted transcriptional regulator